MAAYYNEIDPAAAAWLRELINRDLIAPGVVDERSIEDILPGELAGYTQCHFFAGIGGWSYALRLAGWPDDRPVWTGSCPCQPFSSAGQGAGFADQRHLWPAFQHLIAQCRPAIVFGEQVASKDADPWIDLVHADLENLGYAFGCIPFPSAGIGAPHIRDRNYWVGLADPDNARLEGRRVSAERAAEFSAGPRGLAGGLAHSYNPRPQLFPGSESAGIFDEAPGSQGRLYELGADRAGVGGGRSGPTNGFWRSADWLGCRDGKWRPVEPGTQPLAYGLPARMVRLRGFGNAINAEAAKAFIESYLEATASGSQELAA